MKNLNLKSKKYKTGFTVLETIIAITMMASVIGGVSLVVKNNINALSVAKEEVRAFYLAQEVIEVIRNRRDSNQLSNLYGGVASTWLAGIADIGDPCESGKTCRIDGSVEPTNANAFVTCIDSQSWGNCPNLNQDSSSYLYGYASGAGWSLSMYKREVQIENVVGQPNQVSVTVLISWSHAGVAKSFKTKTLLTNWF